MKKKIHCKENINKNLQIMIFKATKNIIQISINPQWIKACLISVVVFLIFFGWVFNSFVQQNQIIIEQNKVIASLKIDKQAYEDEIFMLYGMLEQKDRMLSSKTEEIEQRLALLDDFKQYIIEFVGLEQDSSEEFFSLVSRSEINRSFSINQDTWKENLSSDEVDEKLIDFKLELSQKVKDFDRLFDDVVGRIDYLERFPDFFPTTGTITSGFAYRTNPITNLYEFHKGIDIANHQGTPIRAAGAGKVIAASYDVLFGKHIVIDHGLGLTSRYAHLNEFKVEVGEEVSKGQLLGAMGSTGQSTGPHLHFEIHIWGNHMDPTNIKEYFE